MYLLVKCTFSRPTGLPVGLSCMMTCAFGVWMDIYELLDFVCDIDALFNVSLMILNE